ncbi:MAG: hypothetical protein ACK5RL_07640 [Acidimicrobiales bacterium]
MAGTDPPHRRGAPLTPEEERRFRELTADLDGSPGQSLDQLEADISGAVGWRLRLRAALVSALGWWWFAPILIVAGLVAAMLVIQRSPFLAMIGVAVAALGVVQLTRGARSAVRRLSGRDRRVSSEPRR